MIRVSFITAAAVLALAAPAFAQTADTSTSCATTPSVTTNGFSNTGAAPACTPAGTSPGPTFTGVIGITPPGVAGGVVPYQPAGAPASATSAVGLPSPAGATAYAPGVPVVGPTSGPGVSDSINATLQAGQIVSGGGPGAAP